MVNGVKVWVPMRVLVRVRVRTGYKDRVNECVSC